VESVKNSFVSSILPQVFVLPNFAEGVEGGGDFKNSSAGGFKDSRGIIWTLVFGFNIVKQ
jgi:hypothetical protein